MIPNIVTSISGKPKSGKTHLALTFPDPIAVFSFDLGTRFVVDKFKDKDIDVFEYPLPVVDSLTTMNAGFPKFWERIKKDIYDAIAGKDKPYKTVVIDTATALWEIIRYAFNEQEGKEVGSGGRARNYGEPNTRMYGVVMRAQVGGVNLVLTSYLKERWVDDVNTGEMVLDGWRRTEGLADLVLLTEAKTRVATPEEKKQYHTDKRNIIETTIASCRFDMNLAGVKLEMATYDDLLAVLGITE